MFISGFIEWKPNPEKLSISDNIMGTGNTKKSV
jgi:hypothetical protein